MPQPNLDQNNWIPAAICGAALVALSALLIRSHRRAWRKQQADTTLDEFERKHLFKRFRRRVQTSSLIGILGVAIALGDSVVWRVGGLGAGLYWIGILLVAMWVMLLALGDMATSRAHYRAAAARMKLQREALEKQAEMLKQPPKLKGDIPP